MPLLQQFRGEETVPFQQLEGSVDPPVQLSVLPGRVRSQITSVVLQIHRFDFDCNLVLTKRLILAY